MKSKPKHPKARSSYGKRRRCYFTDNNFTAIDYKDIDLLKEYIGPSGKITPSYYTGTRNYFQRKLTSAIKRARYVALLPYTDNHKQ